MELKDGEGGYVFNVEVLSLMDVSSKGASRSNGLLKKALIFLPTKHVSELFTGERRGRIAFTLREGAISVLSMKYGSGRGEETLESRGNSDVPDA